jgi:hypothetical protein
LASPVTIDITGYSNEDIDRQFTLRAGDAQSSAPFNLTGVTFEAEIRDQTNALVLRMTTENGGIVITDAVNGVFKFHIDQGAVVPGPKQSLKYDLLMASGGEFRRLWGGAVKIAPGVTVPD